MADYAGQQLGNYRLRHRIGRGGAADVYLGEHIHLETLAAIKVLHMQIGSNDLDDFRREARTIAHLLHPNIVRVLDFGVEGTTPFLVMDYAPRGTLRQCHAKGTRLPLSTIISYVNQVAPALQYAHERKVIHRDVKPENMLLGINDQVLLSDFGISAVEQSTSLLLTLKRSGSSPVGTAYYIAPEQIQGNPCVASDQYALGIVVYEWLCGSCPFQGEALSVMYRHVYAPVPPLREQLPDLSFAVEHVVLKALAKEPQQRFATTWDFAKALEQAGQVQESGTFPAWPLAIPAQQAAQAEKSATLLPRPYLGQSALNPIAAQKEPGSSPAGNSRTPMPAAPQAESLAPLHLRPYANAASIQSVQTATEPDPMLKSASSIKPISQRKGSLRGVTMLLIGLAVIISVGSAAFLLSSLNNQSNATSASNIQATAAVNAYNAAAAANGVMPGFNAQNTRVNPYEKALKPGNVSQLILAWKFLTRGGIGSVPTVANGIVYVSSGDNDLYALDAGTGKALWTAPAGSYYLGSGPTVANGTVYIGSYYTLYALAAGTGAIDWTATTEGSIGSSPTLVNGVIYIGSDKGKLYAFNASMGANLWTASTRGAIRSSPAVANGIVYVGSEDHHLYAIKAATGAILWSTSTGDQIRSSPAVVNRIVYAGSIDGKLYAFNAATGAVLWTALTGGSIFSSPAVANGVVYIGSNDGKLYAFNASGCGSISCPPLWTASTGGSIFSSPTFANGVVYVGSIDHKLYAFNASGCRSASCQPLWTASTGDKILSSPVVANGFVYVGSNDSRIYAFHLPGASP